MRKYLNKAGLLGLFIFLFYTALNMKPFAAAPQGIGTEITKIFLAKTQALNGVASIVFDFRGYDTFGEAIILFTAVAGTVAVLRGVKDDHSINVSNTLSTIARTTVGLMVPFLTVFGCYVILHGHLSPGGGFQGGVALAAAPVLVFLTEGRNKVLQVIRKTRLSILESMGSLLFLFLAVTGILRGGAFFANRLDKGIPGRLYSSGTIFWMNLAVGLKVFAGISIIVLLFITLSHPAAGKEEDQ
jgi:multisubunit Na+/H+ antiporter MnhB subunit